MLVEIGTVYDGKLKWLHLQEDAGLNQLVGCDSDFFIVNSLPGLPPLTEKLINFLASETSSWIEVFGNQSEIIHDHIDAASIKLHGHEFIGAGKPMTSWSNECNFDCKLADYLLSGGQGDKHDKVIVFLGENRLAGSFLAEIQKTILGRGERKRG